MKPQIRRCTLSSHPDDAIVRHRRHSEPKKGRPHVEPMNLDVFVRLSKGSIHEVIRILEEGGDVLIAYQRAGGAKGVP